MPPDHLAVGEFGNGENTWRLRDAVAVRRAEGVVLRFARLSFDRRGWVLDAQFSVDDLALFLDNDHDYAPTLDVRLDGEGKYAGHRVVYGEYGADWKIDSAFAHSVVLHINDGRRIAGTVRFAGEPGRADVDFDLPVLEIGPLPRPGVNLPADGGAPGRHLLARSTAIHAGDLDRLLALLSAEERRDAVGHVAYDPEHIIDFEPGDLERSGVSLFMLKQRMSMPRIGRIGGGSIDGTTAWIDFEGFEEVIGSDAVAGTAVLSQDRRGGWQLEEIVTRPVQAADDGE
jgi:hypothetical protein